jgi:hypothetical protein
VCVGVPTTNVRGPATTPTFGNLCRGLADTCADPGTFSCPGVAGNPTADEIFAAVRPLVPPNTTIDQMRFSYSFDENLGFLGGPYVPMVTVEFVDVNFRFIAPLGWLAGTLTDCSNASSPNEICMPSMSVTLPGEDLALGTNGWRRV